MPLSFAPLALATASTPHLRAPDLAIIAAYLIAITIFGLRFHSRGAPQERSLKNYFLAGNTVPWWAIALSVVSAETSTLTIISIPGVAFAGDFGFLQVVLGYLVGRVIVAALFLPRYFAGEMLTAYQLIDRRFGPILHKVTAGLFLLTRAAAEGVRVFAVSIVVSIAIGTGDVLSVGLISALTLLYTFEGGLAAVIWTDVVQMGIYVGGTVIALVSLGHHVPGGWSAIAQTAGAAHKFDTLNFALNVTQNYTFWAGLLGGTFLTMASHGTDQLMVQRLLAARNLRQSQLALLSSGVVILVQFAFFLLIGAGLWVFYASPIATGHLLPGTASDRLFPTFITREMPTGVAGLLVAAILAAAMSNLSAALNSLSSTTVVDFYIRLRPEASDRERTLVSKSSTAVWALVLFAIAIVSLRAGGKGHVVEIGLSIASVAYGCLLGVFLLGALTRLATETGAIAGMLVGFAVNLWLWQGTFPAHLGPVTVPHVAFTWYVLIGALVTFAVGSIASLMLGERNRRNLNPAASAVVSLLLLLLSSPRGLCVLLLSLMLGLPKGVFVVHAQTPAPASSSRPERSAVERSAASQATQAPAMSQPTTAADFSQVSQLINDAIAHHQLPGAVVVIGHNGHVAFEQAYGDRKLAGEPGLDGQPSPAEPMTEDTFFDMASLTKVIVTTTAIGELYDAGKLDFDTPVEHYLPDFNPAVNGKPDPERSKVTLRLLLTHFSGEAPDISLKDPWGLAAPDKAEGFRRALTNPLASTPGTKFVYSDINFILLGAIVEKLSGEPLQTYATAHIFQPLGMLSTRYHAFREICGTHKVIGAAVYPNPAAPQTIDQACSVSGWFVQDIAQTAPTAHDDELNAGTNPNYDHLLRGTVHDPTTRRMGGVAGHAGAFSTAHDMTLFAQALLDRYSGRPSKFPVQRKTLLMVSQPQQPGHTADQVAQHARANAEAIARGDKPASGDPALLDPNFPAIKDEPLRGFGWDIDTGYSKPRGRFPIGSFGHTGFTGTSVWLDPTSDTFVLLLSNAIHPKVGAAISNLRGEVATAAMLALHLYPSQQALPRPEAATQGPSQTFAGISGRNGDNAASSAHQPLPSSRPERSAAERSEVRRPTLLHVSGTAGARGLASGTWVSESHEPPSAHALPISAPTLTGVDVLVATGEKVLLDLAARNGRDIAKATGPELRMGLLTNQTGLDRGGNRTIDFLNATRLREDGLNLTTLFSPEHGIFGRQDSEHLNAETDPATGIHVTSLYGARDSDRRPSHEQLKNLDVVLVDLQDAGVRCFTYESVLGYFLEAAAAERKNFHHDLHILVLDRPNPITGNAVAGPTSDAGSESYINYMPLPFQHGLTFGELARYIQATKHLDLSLSVVPMQNWHREQFFDQTGLPWTPPSPNLHTLTAATLYPATAMLELTNLSVGRGTPLAFEVFGTASPAHPGTGTEGVTKDHPWFSAEAVADALNRRQIPGVRFESMQLAIPEDANHYPGHGQTIPAVHIVLTDRSLLNAPALGVEVMSALYRLYPTQFQLEKSMRIVANRETLNAIKRGDNPRHIFAAWQADLETFTAQRKASLLY